MPTETTTVSHSTMVTVLSLALQAVSQRIVVLLAMAMTFGLFCWAMWMHQWIALAIAGSFAVSVFLPVLQRSAKNAGQND